MLLLELFETIHRETAPVRRIVVSILDLVVHGGQGREHFQLLVGTAHKHAPQKLSAQRSLLLSKGLLWRVEKLLLLLTI